QFSLPPDPASWGANVRAGHVEEDDILHNPNPRRDQTQDKTGSIFTGRGLSNLGCLFVLVGSLVTLFAGYLIITYFKKKSLSALGGYNVGGINGTGQVPSMAGNWGLVDLDTPSTAHTTTSYGDGSEWQLIFSDEFNTANGEKRKDQFRPSRVCLPLSATFHNTSGILPMHSRDHRHFIDS
ncbi:glycoside hydrolase family 16 protein, partial [Athelia psychrophila]